jgi:polyisoprenoid-binding protein YceI
MAAAYRFSNCRQAPTPYLRSTDFFDVSHAPYMTFRSMRVERKSQNKFKVVGDLTIRGITRPLE